MYAEAFGDYGILTWDECKWLYDKIVANLDKDVEGISLQKMLEETK